MGEREATVRWGRGGRWRPAAPAPLQEGALRAALEGSLGVAFSDDNAVQLLEDADVLRRLAGDLRRARRSIAFQVYYVERGRVLQEFAEIFRERAAAGVRVLVLLDAVGTKGLSLRGARRMFGDRVEVELLRSWRSRRPLRFLRRAHCRSCVVDGSVAYSGGFGLSDKWAPAPGEGPAWRELGLRMEGSAALRLLAHFAALWAEARGGDALTGEGIFPPDALDGRGKTAAGALVSSPGQPVSAAIRFLDLLASSARRRLWIYSGYFAPGTRQSKLLEGAARRGVDVRVLTADEQTDLRSVRLAGRGTYRSLLDAGVRIWEYHPRMLHAKAYLLDDSLVAVGSLNVEPVTTRLGDETAVMALDAGLAETLARTFSRDLEWATEVTRGSLDRQPVWRRLLERASATFTRIP